jgi:EmrB/QacA subfamily drug resistance transporter
MKPSRLIPLVVAAALFMENMDSTVIATSLPAIAEDLGTNPVSLKLAFTTYLLSLTIFIPISGWCADRFGAKNVFRMAIAVFALGSIACGMSQSLPWLVGSRALQGLGGAMMVPVGRIVLLRAIPKSELVDAMAWLTIPALMGPLIGPPFGGFVTTYFDWRYIFWINVPFGVLAILLATWLMPEGNDPPPPPLDWSGFLLSGLGLSLTVAGATSIGRELLPWEIPLTLMAVGVIFLVLYVRHARRAANPILDLSLANIPTFRAGLIGGSLYRVGIGAIPFLTPLLFQLGFGLTAFQSGMLTCAAALGALSMKFTAARLIRRFGFRNLLVLNGAVSCALLAVYALLAPGTPYVLIVMVLLTGGFLRSLQFTALNAIAYSDIDNAAMSRAASLYTVAQQLSLSVGVMTAAGALELSHAWRGGAALAFGDFALAFLAVSAIAALSVFQFTGLAPGAGASVSGRGS